MSQKCYSCEVWHRRRNPLQAVHLSICTSGGILRFLVNRVHSYNLHSIQVVSRSPASLTRSFSPRLLLLKRSVVFQIRTTCPAASSPSQKPAASFESSDPSQILIGNSPTHMFLGLRDSTPGDLLKQKLRHCEAPDRHVTVCDIFRQRSVDVRQRLYGQRWEVAPVSENHRLAAAGQ
jgi:hypothetical protein